MLVFLLVNAVFLCVYLGFKVRYLSRSRAYWRDLAYSFAGKDSFLDILQKDLEDSKNDF